MKRLWIVFPALLLIAGTVFMLGCPNPTDPIRDITWTLSANGAGENNVGITDTTEITITFSKEPTDLVGQNISITGGPATISGSITGTGTTRVVPVAVTGSGSVSITINRTGIEAGPKSVQVWKQGEESLIGYTAVANGTADTETSTAITLTFDEAVTGLTADDITITPVVGATGGDASKDTLTGSGTTWTLNILVTKAGAIQVTIAKEGIYAGATTVAVYKEVEEGPPAIPEDGQTAALKWHRLAVDHSDDDPEAQAENEALGKGVITGDDFDAIVAATAYQDTYLRIYLDLTEYTSQAGWGVGALGNVLGDDGKPSGSGNLGFNAPSPLTDYAYVNVSLKNLKNYYDVDDGEIFVNIWNGAKVRAILLYEPIPAVPEEELEEGITEFTLPETEGVIGKGFFGSPDVTKLNAAKPGSYLKLSGANAPGAEYGFGRLIGSGWANKGDELKTPAGTAQGADFELEVLVANIKYAFEVLDYDSAQKWANGTITGSVGLNLYNDAYLTKILLIEPEDGEDPPPPDLPEPPEFEVEGNLGDFTLENNSTQKGWGSNGTDNVVGPAIAEFKAAKYIVLKVTDLESRDGVGGLQFVIQGDHDNWNWNQTNITGDWTSFSNVAEDITYVVIPLSEISNWTTAVAASGLTQLKVIIGGVDKLGTLLGAWLLEDDAAYTKPANAVDFEAPSDGTGVGYLVAEDDFDWDLPEGSGSDGEPHDFIIDLAPNGEYGHQEKFMETWLFNGEKITTGDVYVVSFDVVSSFALDYVNLFLVDNSENNGGAGNWGWTVLSNYGGTNAIGTTTTSSHSVTLTATGTATDASPAANILGFTTSTETVFDEEEETGVEGNITLTITNFTFVKQ